MFDSDKKREVIKPNGFDEALILKQVKAEQKQGQDAVTAKRDKLKKDLSTYYVAATKKDKVGVHSIYTTMQTLMSVYYNDRAEVEFEGRTSAGDAFAENINRLAKFDYDEMDLDKVDYQWNWDRFFH